MDEQDKMLEKMREIALNNPDSIRIIETNVDAEVQIEFFETLQRIGNEEQFPEPAELWNQLHSEAFSYDQKKEILARLTSYGEVETYRMLEDYLKAPEDQLKTWAYLSYQQARMFLESNLMEESKIYIASGLGGKDHRLRYIFALSSKDNTFTEAQKNIVNGEIEYFIKKNDGFTEEIIYSGNYIICTAIIALHINLIELIQDIVFEINQYGAFLRENVFITNEKRIDSTDLDKVFKEPEDTPYIPDKD
ncbi:MAG: hypothetical protein PHE56_09700 [Bacteroidales bacterium]|jgi:hypothetical protein|nr:hypothetical protein [Bacteroidales bacterium]